MFRVFCTVKLKGILLLHLKLTDQGEDGMNIALTERWGVPASAARQPTGSGNGSATV